jgi:glycosyltransferase involved in cell wall biosynthesis
VAKLLGKPYVITARGTDLNLIPQHLLPRKMIQWAARGAQASIGVCSALMDVLRSWGLPPEQLLVMRNGVDLKRFTPLRRDQACRELDISGAPVLLSVGHLVERKGHHVAIEALAMLLPDYPAARLVLVGDGPERQRLVELAGRLGIQASVHFAGARPNNELARWYSAADILVLASSREGWANVLLESMACGTPVVATRIWGTPEVVRSETVGTLVEKREPAAFAEAIKALYRRAPARGQVRTYAEDFSWAATTNAQLELFRRISGASQEAPPVA